MSNTQGLFSTTLANPSGYPGQSFFGGNNIAIFVDSGTFVVPPDVYRIRVRVWGAGGSGGVSCAVANARVCSGGGGGGHGIKVVATTPGTSYSVTVGAGGAAVTGGATTNGNPGGTSSFGTLVTCTGGGGGLASAGAAPQTVAGGAGGTSTGGDLNYSGGAGGSATNASDQAGQTRSVASGGGSSGSIFGNGYAGGNAETNWVAAPNNLACASGGGGVGGKGGNAKLTTGFTDWYSKGGGTFSAAKDSDTSVSTQLQNAGTGFVLPFKLTANVDSTNMGVVGTAASLGVFNSLPLERYNMFGSATPQPNLGNNLGSGGWGSGGYFNSPYPQNAINRFPGDILISSAGGSGGSAAFNIMVDGCGRAGSNQSTAETTVNKIAGVFGGGGGTADIGNNVVKGIQGSIAGGGGGTAGRSNPDSGTFSGAGGHGMVIVEW